MSFAPPTRDNVSFMKLQFPTDKDTNLLLNVSKLLKISFQESHLLLLGFVVACTQYIVVLFSSFIQRNFEFDYLFASVLKITHQGLLHNFEVCQLLGHGLAHSLHVLFLFGQVRGSLARLSRQGILFRVSPRDRTEGKEQRIAPG
jgi:hypothetical protein